MDKMRYTMCRKVLHVYIMNAYVFFYVVLVYEICTGSATLTLIQTAYDSTEYNRSLVPDLTFYEVFEQMI